MTENSRNEYYPDSVTCPGRTIQETLEHLGMSQTELAERTGRPVKTINEIINGKAAITPDTALQFERVFNVPARFWNNLESGYREYVAREEERKRLEEAQEWLKELPLKDMHRLNWVQKSTDKVEQVRAVLNFFGIASPKSWKELCPKAAYRNTKAFESEPASVAAWLRMGDIEARRVDCLPYNEFKLTKRLPELRKLTLEPPEIFQAELVRICAECGVAVVFVPELTGTRLCGAVRWITSEKALLQLSLRYKTDDHVWFTFFHELAHIMLHGKRDYFIDTENDDKNDKEREADQFASNLLLPPREFATFAAGRKFTRDAILRFSKRICIAPGIVVGRLQHDGLIGWRSACNHLKTHYRFKTGSD